MTRLDGFVADALKRCQQGGYALSGEPLPPNGSLVDAIAKHPSPVIAELKPRSPSAGQLLQGPAEPMLAQYAAGGAVGISCLTDGDHFGGSPALVRTAHATGLPVLWKDFVVDDAQVQCAAHNGASAILVIERVLTPAKREALVASAHAAGLEVLLEIFDAADWETAQDSAADLIGVNARNLDTLATDIDAAAQLIQHVASERAVVALSGVSTRQARLAMVEAGASAVLVGTHLMTNPDPGLALRALQHPIAKTCGLRSTEDIQAAVNAGAELVGFVVGAPASPRNLEPIRAQQLSDAAKAQGLRTVLVTPHDDDWEVREWCRLVKPDYVQLHGVTPNDEWLHSLGAIPTVPIHIVRPGTSFPDAPFLLDGSEGTGTTATWPAGCAISKHLTLVAGGLDAHTAAAAITTTGAWGADASSGLESSPGTKDPERMASFVEACHGA